MNRLISAFLISLLTACGACTTPSRQPQSDPNPDAVAPLQSNPEPTTGSTILTVTSWNVKHLGRERFASEQASPILAGADVVTFQEVNKSKKGLAALRRMATQLETLTKERICLAVSEVPTDGSEIYGYLWKNSRISFVTKDGRVIDDCGKNDVKMVRLGVRHAAEITREPAFATFLFKPRSMEFVLASIHLRPKNKRPQDEVDPLFATFGDLDLPVIVAGDYNLDSTDPSFQAALQLQFAPALSQVKTSLKQKKRELNEAYDNFWYRKFKLVGAPSVTNLYEVFKEKDQREIYDNFSDHCPITAKFDFL